MSDTTSGDDTGGSSSGASSSEEDTGVLLDIADRDVGWSECASVEQSTVSEKLPSDVIIVVDPELPDDLRYDAYATLQNLQPQLYTDDGEGGARVILLAGPPPVCPPPPEVDLGDNPCCGEWTCWIAPWYDDTPVPVGGGLLRPPARHRPRHDAHRPARVVRRLASAASRGVVEARVVVHEPQRGRDRGVHFLREDGEGASYSDFVVPIQELIQSNALSCAYAIPDPPNGLIFERERVNVAYDVGLGPEMLGYVDAVEDCVVFGHGWYHDDVVDPREIDRCTRPESR